MQLLTGLRHLGVLLSYPRPARGPGPGQQEPQHGTHRHSYTATVPTNPLSPDLTNQTRRPVALVTGATRGLGRSIAEALASDHHLLIGGREADTVQGVVNALPSAAPFVANLTDEQETERASAGVGRLDVLIHCAGIIPPADVSLRDAWRRVLETNVVAVAHLTDLLLPTLRQSVGLVVVINSGSGLNAYGDTGGYSGSKFALTSFADGLREAERGRVRVSSVHPGRIDTDMQRELQSRAGRSYVETEHLTADAVAAVVRTVVDCPVECLVESVTVRPWARLPR